MLATAVCSGENPRPGEGLDSAASEGPAVPVDPLSLSSLLSQGFEEGRLNFC